MLIFLFKSPESFHLPSDFSSLIRKEVLSSDVRLCLARRVLQAVQLSTSGES